MARNILDRVGGIKIWDFGIACCLSHPPFRFQVHSFFVLIRVSPTPLVLNRAKSHIIIAFKFTRTCEPRQMQAASLALGATRRSSAQPAPPGTPPAQPADAPPPPPPPRHPHPPAPAPPPRTQPPGEPPGEGQSATSRPAVLSD